MNRKRSALFGRNRVPQLAKAVVVLLIISQTCLSGSALGPVDESALRNAWALCTQQKYAAAADAFEALIRTSTPNARLYYYAAAANRSSNRVARAKQLCQYVIANFPKSPEAANALKLFPAAASSTASASGELPESLKTKNLEELMQTEEGRKQLKEALKKQEGSAVASTTVAASASPLSAKGSGGKKVDQVFTVEDISKDGVGGISHFGQNPDSWLECSMAALAMSPRGQKLIAAMIRSSGGQGTYIVRFPGEALEYTLTQQKIEACRVHDKALWATLIHCAQITQANSDESIEGGLSFLTGRKAEKMQAGTTEQTVLSFIRDAVKSQNPIVCESADDFGTSPELVEPNHAYTITDFDPATNMITIRNPHGANSRRFRLKTDPQYHQFEQLNDGVFKMHISLFRNYFKEVARSSF